MGGRPARACTRCAAGGESACGRHDGARCEALRDRAATVRCARSANNAEEVMARRVTERPGRRARGACVRLWDMCRVVGVTAWKPGERVSPVGGGLWKRRAMTMNVCETGRRAGDAARRGSMRVSGRRGPAARRVDGRRASWKRGRRRKPAAGSATRSSQRFMRRHDRLGRADERLPLQMMFDSRVRRHATITRDEAPGTT